VAPQGCTTKPLVTLASRLHSLVSRAPLDPAPLLINQGNACVQAYIAAPTQSKRQGAEAGAGQVRGCPSPKSPAAPCSPAPLPCLPPLRRYGVWVEENGVQQPGCRVPEAWATPPASPCPSLCIETALTAACSPSWASPAALTTTRLPAPAHRLPCAGDSESKPSRPRASAGRRRSSGLFIGLRRPAMPSREELQYSDFTSDDEDREEEDEEDDDNDEEGAPSGRARRGGNRRRQRSGGRGSKSSWLPHEDELLTRWASGGGFVPCRLWLCCSTALCTAQPAYWQAALVNLPRRQAPARSHRCAASCRHTYPPPQ
jgi:hypothetical protein